MKKELLQFDGTCPKCKGNIVKKFNEEIIKQQISLGFTYDKYSSCDPDEWNMEDDGEICFDPIDYPDYDEEVYMLDAMDSFECPHCKHSILITPEFLIEKVLTKLELVKNYLKENCNKWGDLTDEQWVELQESIGVKRVNYVNIDDIVDETPFRYCMEVHFLLIDDKLYCHPVFNGEYTTMEENYNNLEIWEKEFLNANGFNKNRFEEEEPHIDFESLI